MKEYDRFIIWLDYFDSSLKRREGRRVPLNASTRSPKIEELTEACDKLGLKPSREIAKHPRSHGRDSGYVSVPKAGAKRDVMLRVARELAQIRGMAARKASATTSGRKK